jgi:Cu-Zn family superoxide dismutase
MRSWRKALASAICVAGVAIGVSAALGQGTKEYSLPGPAVFPEGVAALPDRSVFYVGSTTDGTIFRGRLARSEASVFLPGGGDGRTAATGLKLDRRGRLYVSGAATAKMFVYAASGKLVRAFDSADGREAFINDVALTRSGDAYFTDSRRPVLFRVTPRQLRKRSSEVAPLKPWLDFTGTALEYQTGFNVNGIAATGDGRHLIVVQTNTGALFRIATATKRVVRIQTPTLLTNGDGLLVRGRTLYVVRNAAGTISKLRLNRRFTRATAAGSITDPTFAFPTTMAQARNRFLVVNAQFDKRGGSPKLPFTVSSLPADR